VEVFDVVYLRPPDALLGFEPKLTISENVVLTVTLQGNISEDTLSPQAVTKGIEPLLYPYYGICAASYTTATVLV
jgi:hypothetical protein